jgi:glutathione-independent formaldehyde dehydrogenase
MEHTNGVGADRGAECVGYQAHDPRGHEDNSATLNDLISSRLRGPSGMAV